MQVQSSEADDWETVAEGMTTPSAAKAAAFMATPADTSATNKRHGLCHHMHDLAEASQKRNIVPVSQHCSARSPEGPPHIVHPRGGVLPVPAACICLFPTPLQA